MACILKCLTNQRNVVGCTAAATSLRNQNCSLSQIVLARKHRLHNLTCNQDRWVANIVVNVTKTHINGTLVN